jgi:hypothetical protein
VAPSSWRCPDNGGSVHFQNAGLLQRAYTALMVEAVRAPLKRWFTSILHGSVSQKTVISCFTLVGEEKCEQVVHEEDFRTLRNTSILMAMIIYSSNNNNNPWRYRLWRTLAGWAAAVGSLSRLHQTVLGWRGQHIESHSCIFSFPNRTVTSLFK